jgi:hypothetical protein
MEDIERYHQMLIDMKEHYQIDVKLKCLWKQPYEIRTTCILHVFW